MSKEGEFLRYEPRKDVAFPFRSTITLSYKVEISKKKIVNISCMRKFYFVECDAKVEFKSKQEALTLFIPKRIQ